MRKQSRWLTLAFIIGAAIALLAFSACGGDDDDSTGSNTATAKASSTGSATQGSSDETAEPTDSGDDGGDDLGDLANFGEGLSAATGTVTYESTDKDTNGTVTTSTFTIYSDGQKTRYDTVDESDPTSVTSFIVTPDGSYSCAEDQCIKFAGSTGGGNPFAAIFSPELIDSYISELAGIDVDKTDENIAGDDATCYSWHDNTNDITTKDGKLCFNGDGLMVLLATEDTDGSTSSMKATSVSSDVSDSDFDPPFPVMTIPGA